MHGLGSGSFDPKTLAALEAAFDETWLTLKLNGQRQGSASRACAMHSAPRHRGRDRPGASSGPSAFCADSGHDMATIKLKQACGRE